MSCDHLTYYNTIVDLASYSGLAVEPGDYPAARETEVSCDRSPNRCRSETTADQFRSKAHRHVGQSRIIPDSTQPEYVWGDEGPIND